jgi:N-acetylglucosaminyldiphosphoundecaprenol N-acetyl-beta-D-mannosaminyltransferase
MIIPESGSAGTSVAGPDATERITLLGTLIDNLSLHETADRVCDMIESRGPYGCVVTPNVDHIMRLHHDSLFREVYANAALVVPDGVPLVWASRFLKTPLKGRVNGTDLFELLAARSADRGYRLFFLGGNPGAAERAAEVLVRRHPALVIAGTYCPPFGFDSDETLNREIQNRIRSSGADILFIGIGAPRQELWMYRYGSACGVSMALGIGVSFSLVGGDISRAPVWMQRSGLEWFWRLLTEPGRLWKRYLVDDIPFLWLVLREWLRIRKNR